MANAEVTRLVNTARVRLPGALDAGVQLELFSVLDSFLKKTNAWRENIQFTALPSDDTYTENPAAYTYALVPPETSNIVRLVAVVDADEAPRAATMPKTSEVVLQTLPAASEVLYAHVVLTVSDPVTWQGYPELPQWITERYWDVLLDGLLGNMMSQIAKPYSSPQIALYHLRKFSSGTAKARVEVLRQNLYGAQAWRFPQTFSRSR